MNIYSYRFFVSLLFIVLMPLKLSSQQKLKALSLDLITNGTFSAASAGYSFKPYMDGAYYTILSPDRSAILKCSYQTGETVDTLFYAPKARECHFKAIDAYLIAPSKHHILILTETEAIYRRSRKYKAYVYDVRRNYVEPLLKDEKAKIRIPLFSPNGRQLAYVKEDNNIYIKNLDYNSEVAVTTDGAGNKILNGVTDWVYEEELYETSLMKWSDDSEVLMYAKTDETEVPSYNMQIWGRGTYPQDYRYKYPKAGEPNSQLSVYAYQVMDKLNSKIELPIKEEFYLSRIDYAFGKFQLFTLNRNQNYFRLISVNPKSKLCSILFSEQSSTYIDNDHLRSLCFGPEGFYYVSEAGDYAVLSAYDTAGKKIKDLSSKDKDLTSFYGVGGGRAYYAIAAPSPADRQIYSTDIRTAKSRLLSPEAGFNTAVFSRDYHYYLLSHSSATEVPVFTLNDSHTGKKLVVLEDNQALKNRLQEYALPRKHFIDITTASGQSLKAYVIEPLEKKAAEKYPALFVQYSGPNSQQVQNKYGLNWEYFLASKGIVVVCVDGRGTAARGVAFRKATYKRMGVLEAEDQCAAASAFAKSRDDIDPNRLGIWGWSFGGYTTLMAMCMPTQTFSAGIAVAPPTDWRFYDTIYSERYMMTPAENPNGYEETSVIKRVPDFKGKLLLIQGTADDNVHLQNTMSFVKAMVENNKYYEMLIYPDKNHSIYGGNTRRQLFNSKFRFLERELLRK